MSYESTRQAIQNRFKTQWGTTTDIAWEGVPYTPTTGRPYVQFWIIPGFGEQMDLGPDAQWKYVDSIQVDVFVPDTDGTKNLSTYGDAVIAIFKNQTFDGITVQGVRIYRDVHNGWRFWKLVFTSSWRE